MLENICRIPSLGVLKARQIVLTNNSTGKEMAASPCVNPVVDRWWDFRGHRYHIKGLHKSVEEVKERNGPFAGKRVSRPVADYEACHSVVLNNIQKLLSNNFEYVLKVDVKKFMFFDDDMKCLGNQQKTSLHSWKIVHKMRRERFNRSIQGWKCKAESLHGLSEARV